MGRATSKFLAVVQAIGFALCVASAQEPGPNGTTAAISASSTDKSLMDLAKNRFSGEWSAISEKFFAAAEDGMPFGRPVDKYFDQVDRYFDDDRNKIEEWGPQRTIPAQWIRWLCTDAEAKSLVSPSGINLVGVRIKDKLDLRNWQIPFPLTARGCVFDAGIDLADAHLLSARFVACSFRFLSLRRLKVDRDFVFDSWSVVSDSLVQTLDSLLSLSSKVDLSESSIGGDLLCDDTALDLKIDAANIGGSVFLRHISSPGASVSLRRAIIGGDLDCSFSLFVYRTGTCVEGQGAKIAGNLDFFFADVEREISVEGASIGQNLDFRGASLDGVTASSVTVGKSVLFADPLDPNALDASGDMAQEEINQIDPLHHSSLTGTLAFTDATIAGAFQWDTEVPQSEATLDLTRAKAGRLLNNPSGALPKNKLLLAGFLFDRLDGYASTDSQAQIKWLRLQPNAGLLTQPYDQMADAFRNIGLPDQAIDILIAENWDHVRAFYPTSWIDLFNLNKLLALLWYRVLGPLIGYGYRPANGLWFFLFFLVLGARVFQKAHSDGVIVPTKPHADQTPNYPKFQPFIYSLETFVPLLKFSMGDYWGPNDASDKPILILPPALKKCTFHFLYGRLDAERRLATSSQHSPSLLVRHYLWIHIICGWIITTLLVAGLSGILKKN
jgi:hypothetical protein